MIVLCVRWRGPGESIGQNHGRYRTFDWPAVPENGDVVEVWDGAVVRAQSRREFMEDGNVVIVVRLADPGAAGGPTLDEQVWTAEDWEQAFGKWAESYQAALEVPS